MLSLNFVTVKQTAQVIFNSNVFGKMKWISRDIVPFTKPNVARETVPPRPAFGLSRIREISQCWDDTDKTKWQQSPTEALQARVFNNRELGLNTDWEALGIRNNSMQTGTRRELQCYDSKRQYLCSGLNMIKTSFFFPTVVTLSYLKITWFDSHAKEMNGTGRSAGKENHLHTDMQGSE